MSKASVRHQMGGFTLVEVLITIVVLSVGVLGVAALQVTTMRASQSAYFRTQAASLAQQMVDTIRANRTAALDAGRYDAGFAQTLSCGPDSKLAVCDLATWKAALRNRLPRGRGKVSVSDAAVVTVCIRWSEPTARQAIAVRADACTGALQGRRQFELETIL